MANRITVVDVHDEVRAALAAWVLGACEDGEARHVAAHVDQCPGCAAEAEAVGRAANWYGAAYPLSPPATLRYRILAAAAARPAGQPSIETLRQAYLGQVVALTGLLDGLDGRQLAEPVPRHGTVRDLVGHLAGNDRTVLAALGSPTPTVLLDEPTQWRHQSGQLLRYLDRADRAALMAPVVLAGAAQVRRPAWEALIQRTFETWTHADDIRRAVRQPRRDPGDRELRLIVDFAMRLLPAAIEAVGRAHPAVTVRLDLTGPGGGSWDVPLARVPAATQRITAVTTAAAAFCRLMAGRLAISKLAYRSEDGDPAAIGDFLYAASTLGCD